MSEHAALPPSSAHRWMICPGSVSKENTYPDDSSPYAVDGTHSHTLLEYCLKNNIHDATMTAGTTIRDHDGEFLIDLERAKRVNVALRYIEKRKLEYPNLEIASEERVHPGSLIDRNDIWGTCDVRLNNDDFYEIIDYKDGFVPVAPDNPQNKLYGVGSLIPNLKSETYKIPKNITLTIVQPKMAIEHKPTVNSITLPTDKLFEWMANDVQKAALATDQPNAPLVAGEHCRYCKHGPNCAERAKDALDKAKIMFDEKDTVIEQSLALNSTHLSDGEIVEIIESTPMIKIFLDDVYQEAKRRFRENKPIKGLKAVRGRGSRSWIGNEEDIAKVLKGMGAPLKSIYSSSFVTPAQALKMNWVKRDGSTKTLTARQLKKLKDDHIDRVAGGIIITGESDPREPVPPDENLFHVEQLPDWIREQ